MLPCAGTKSLRGSDKRPEQGDGLGKNYCDWISLPERYQKGLASPFSRRCEEHFAT